MFEAKIPTLITQHCTKWARPETNLESACKSDSK